MIDFWQALDNDQRAAIIGCLLIWVPAVLWVVYAAIVASRVTKMTAEADTSWQTDEPWVINSDTPVYDRLAAEQTMRDIGRL